MRVTPDADAYQLSRSCRTDREELPELAELAVGKRIHRVTTIAWIPGASAAGAKDVTAYDRAGNAARASFSIVPDSAAPTEASVAVTGGPWFTSTVVPVQATAGSDAGSGVDPGSLVVERDYAPLEGEDEGGWKGDERRCGEFHGHWTRVKLVDNSGPTATQPGCYRYRIRVSDNVGNKSKSEPSEPVTIPRRD